MTEEQIQNLEYRNEIVTRANEQLGRMYRELKEERDTLQQQNKQLIEENGRQRDAIESLYQLCQRGELTSFDLTEADGVLSSLQQIKGNGEES